MQSAGRGLPALTLFDFFQEAPGVILDQVFHYVLPPTVGARSDAPALEVDGSVFPLQAGESLAEIEADYLTDHGRPCPSAGDVLRFVVDRLVPKLVSLSPGEPRRLVFRPTLARSEDAPAQEKLAPGALARALGSNAIVMEQRVWPLAPDAHARGALPDVCVATATRRLYADFPARQLRSVEVLFAAALAEQWIRKGMGHTCIEVPNSWVVSVPLHAGKRYIYQESQWAILVRDGEVLLACGRQRT